MRILYIAEIVGKPGIYCVKSLLPTIRRDREIDFVIANGDGATGGFGIGKNHAIYLRKLGVDVITGGDQTFYKKDIAEHIDKAYYMLRPANLPPEMPGRGWRHYSVTLGAADNGETATTEGTGGGNAAPDRGAAVGGSEAAAAPEATAAAPAAATPAAAPQEPPKVRISVVSLLGQSGYERIHGGNPFTYLSNTIERISKDSVAVIVDFHAQTTAEKYTMFHHADGVVTAVVGSGQRVQTSDAQVFPSGTAVICDAGRTGSQQGVSGFSPEPEINKYLTRIPIKSEESWEGLQLQGVILDLDLASGYVVSFESVRVDCPSPPPQERGQKNAQERGEKPQQTRGPGKSNGRAGKAPTVQNPGRP